MKIRSVLLLSGGLDSAVTLAVAKENGFAVHALTFNYGQRHSIELEAAKKVAKTLGAHEHRVVELSNDIFRGSALTGDFEMPDAMCRPGSGAIPLTYVPARNTVFLSIALAWAEFLEARDIFIGVSAVDYSGYPDCRPEYIEQFEKLANIGTKAVEDGRKFSIHAPLINMTKAQTILKGMNLGVDFGVTWSCYDPTEELKPCLRCESCILRSKGFAGAGFEDPLLRGFELC